MALFGKWFSKKNSGGEDFPPESVFFEQGEPAQAHAAGARRATDAQAPKRQSGRQVSERKSLRLEQRELLYGVVRETMARLGMPTANYKYKVLSLDPQGRQYLIMMDLMLEVASPLQLMSKIEPAIMRDAKLRHNILVSAIYWRFNENQVAEETEDPQSSVNQKIEEAKAAKKAQEDEAIARKKALEEEASARKKALEQEFSQTSDHPAATPSGFPDTLMVDPYDGAPKPGTQIAGRSK